MPLLVGCDKLAKSFGIDPLFEDLSLAIATGERVGVIGPNGSGKSTLMRILAGLERPDGGERVLSRGVRLAYVPQRDAAVEAIEVTLGESSDARLAASA
jgi:ATP-binding cassette subfamily F protein uup